MNLDDIRKDIDAIDKELKELIMKRLDCSRQVALSKIESENYTIYRADREEAILEKLGAGVAEDRKPGYLAVVRKITETSRMYQYGILFDNVEGLYPPLVEGIEIPENPHAVRLVLTRPNIPNAMSSILSMVGDYGYNMKEMKLLSYADDESSVSFELTILGDLTKDSMKKLMLQLSKESSDFRIVEVF